MERLRIKKKLITQNWSMQVNEIATSIIVVNTWLAYCQCRRGDDMMVDKKQKTFYTVLAEEIIDNRLDVANVWLWMLITRVELRNVSSDEILLDHRARIWAHLTPTNRKMKTVNSKIPDQWGLMYSYLAYTSGMGYPQRWGCGFKSCKKAKNL